MSAYLIDTHVFVWLQTDRTRLSATTVDALADPANDVRLSIAGVLELFDKYAKRGGTGLDHVLAHGAKALAADIDEAGVELLPVTIEHAAAMRGLPLHHRDPFDRVLIAQAVVDGMTLVSADRAFDRYVELSLLRP